MLLGHTEGRDRTCLPDFTEIPLESGIFSYFTGNINLRHHLFNRKTYIMRIMQAQLNGIFLRSEGDTLDLISREPIITEIFKIADVVRHVGDVFESNLLEVFGIPNGKRHKTSIFENELQRTHVTICEPIGGQVQPNQ